MSAEVLNVGPNAQSGIAVKFKLPEGLQVAHSATSEGEVNGGLWSVPVLFAGEKATLSVEVVGTTAGRFEIPGEIVKEAFPDPDSSPGDGISGEDDGDEVAVQIDLPEPHVGPSSVEPPALPNTRIKHFAIHGQRVVARFSGGFGAQSFYCQLDHAPPRQCANPAVFRRLPKGRHTLRIAAVDSSGQRDPTPAVRRFRIGDIAAG
jgi:hypothetical protein